MASRSSNTRKRDDGGRAPIPREVESRLLTESLRRCCLCVFLSGDLSQKRVQIAHISGNRSDSRYENLVVLCLDHHDQYDSSTSQSKGLTADEVRNFKARLVDLIQRWDNAPHQIAVPHALVADLSPVGTFTHFLQNPPLQSPSLLHQDADALTLLRALLDPSQRDQVRRLLIDNGFLSQEIDGIETVAIQSKLNPHVGKPYCVVSIGGHSDWSWDVLFLTQSEGKWLQLGRIPLPGQKSYKPIVTYVPGENAGALAIEHVAGYGTGVFQKAATWYRVEPEGLIPLFTYPVWAYVIGWGLPFQRHITGHTSGIPYVIETGSRLDINLKAEYSADPTWAKRHEVDVDIPLFSYAIRLILDWDAEARVFVPSRESTATFDQVEGLFNDDTGAFLRRYLEEIIRLVDKGGKLQRDWVRELVANCPSSSERSRIETALQEATSNHQNASDNQNAG